MDLSDKDLQILRELSHNARSTNKNLAEKVGLSQSGCLERVRRLEERGVLLGAYAAIAPEAVDVGVQALIAVRLKRHTRRAVACPPDLPALPVTQGSQESAIRAAPMGGSRLSFGTV